MTNRLLKPNEMADALSVSERTLTFWRSKGIGPTFLKMGTAKNAQVRYPSVQKVAEPNRES